MVVVGCRRRPSMGNAHHATTKQEAGAFLQSCEKGRLNEVKALAERVGLERAMKLVNEVSDLNAMYGTHLAAEAGHAHVLSFLVHDLKADLMARTVRHNTPLHIAARANQPECVSVLLRAGNCGWERARLLWIAYCKDRHSNPACALNVLPRDMIRLLSVYLMRDSLEFNRLILATNSDGLVPLEYAFKNGARKVFALLVSPATVAQLRGVMGSPLHYAAAKGATEAVVLLLRMKGENVDERNHRKETPLYRACCAFPEAADTVEVLLKHGADPTIAASDGKTPYQEAIARRYAASAQLINKALAEKKLKK